MPDPPPAGLPGGTVTFLFTDLEGSTRLLEAHTAAYRAAVRRHHDHLRGADPRIGAVVHLPRRGARPGGGADYGPPDAGGPQRRADAPDGPARGPAPGDCAAYRERNRVGRLVGRSKPCRRVATRYEQRADRFPATVTLAATLRWL